jgi:hypothetical protein
MAMDKKVRAVLILEIMGRPAEHLKESFRGYLDQLKQDQRIQLISEQVHEPKKVEGLDEGVEMYTAFAEVELKTFNLISLAEIVFDYMPSSVEILEPEEVTFNIGEANNFLNDLAGRLHKYDEIAKISKIQADQAVKKFNELYKMMRAEAQARQKAMIGEKTEEKKEEVKSDVKQETKTEANNPLGKSVNGEKIEKAKKSKKKEKLP